MSTKRIFEINASFPLDGDDQLAHASLVAKMAPAIEALKDAAKAAGIDLTVISKTYTPQNRTKAVEPADASVKGSTIEIGAEANKQVPKHPDGPKAVADAKKDAA